MNAPAAFVPDLAGCTFRNTSAATRNPGASPYIRLPERESYQEYAVRDGVDVAVRDVHRWGGECVVGAWRHVPSPAPAPVALAPREVSGTCGCCGRAFVYTTKGGRGRPRLHCSDVCADLLHDLERLSRSVERWTAATGATPGEVDVVANEIAALAAALRAKAPKAAKAPKGQIAMFVPPAPDRNVKRRGGAR